MKKNKILFIIFSLILLSSFTTPTFAILYAPTGNSLQPIPKDIAPNFSGSINSTSTYSPTYDYVSDLPVEKSNEGSEIVVTKNEDIQKNQSTIWYWSIFIIIAFLSLLFGFKKINK